VTPPALADVIHEAVEVVPRQALPVEVHRAAKAVGIIVEYRHDP
jgi:hypothetical protein